MNGAVEQQLVVHSRQRGRTTWNVLETVGQQMSVVVQSHLDGSHIDNDVTGHMDNGVSGHLDDGVAGSLDAQVGAHLLPAGLGHAATLHMEPTIGTNSLGQQQLGKARSGLFNLLWPGQIVDYLKSTIISCIFWHKPFVFNDIVICHIRLGLKDDKTTLVQVIAWCC